MIDIELLKKDIKECLGDVKSSLYTERVKFSRIEEYFTGERLQWLLSIVLDKSYNNDEVDEIVVEINLRHQGHTMIVGSDLSLGNGLLLKENLFEINKDICDNKEIIEQLKESFLKNIEEEIGQAISLLN
jgi:hypothetical protein